MTNARNKTKPEDTERGPAPANNPEHDPNQTCEPAPGTDDSEKPDCPEGYADRQPTQPPAEAPEQREH